MSRNPETQALIRAITRAKRDGQRLFEVTTTGGKHCRVTNLATGASVTFPYSHNPGNRSFQNTVADLKRYVGFDYSMRKRPQKPKAKNRGESEHLGVLH